MSAGNTSLYKRYSVFLKVYAKPIKQHRQHINVNTLFVKCNTYELVFKQIKLLIFDS